MNRSMYQIDIFENENGDIALQQEDIVQQEHRTVVIAPAQVDIVCDWLTETRDEMAPNEKKEGYE